ncbi:MAG: hypothetical protein WA604_07475 [Candidatus Sulfotelmatobacter sp.]
MSAPQKRREGAEKAFGRSDEAGIASQAGGHLKTELGGDGDAVAPSAQELGKNAFGTAEPVGSSDIEVSDAERKCALKNGYSFRLPGMRGELHTTESQGEGRWSEDASVHCVCRSVLVVRCSSFAACRSLLSVAFVTYEECESIIDARSELVGRADSTAAQEAFTVYG